MTKRDYYDVLGVQRGADTAEIKKAFRQKARKLHPDQNPGDQKMADEFKEVYEAYEVLKDADKKATDDDQLGHSAFEGDIDGGAPYSEPPWDPKRPWARPGSDQYYNLLITLKEAYYGMRTKIRIPRKTRCYSCGGSGAHGVPHFDTCPDCRYKSKVLKQQGLTCPTCQNEGGILQNPCKACLGTGVDHCPINVNIPAGIDTGNQICLEGKGYPGWFRAPPGDLYILIEVEDHEIFERVGDDLFCWLPVPMNIAALGGEEEVHLLDGSQVQVKIPAGTQNGKQLRFRGKGMPNLQQPGKRGDLFVELSVDPIEET